MSGPEGHEWKLPRGTQEVRFRQLHELARLAKGWTIPLPRWKALRFGFKLDWWCYVGPRRYQVVATRQFVEEYERIADIDDAELRLADLGVRVVEDR
jgi:hypothetical protein